MSRLDRLNKFSLKTFTADLARQLNENFETLKAHFDSFYKAGNTVGEGSIKIADIESSGIIKANTITTNQFLFSDGTTLSYEDIERLSAELDAARKEMDEMRDALIVISGFIRTLNEFMNNPIPKEEIDALPY